MTRYSHMTLEEFADLFESHVLASEYAKSPFPFAILLEAKERFDECLNRFEDIRSISNV